MLHVQYSVMYMKNLSQVCFKLNFDVYLKFVQKYFIFTIKSNLPVKIWNNQCEMPQFNNLTTDNNCNFINQCKLLADSPQASKLIAEKD